MSALTLGVLKVGGIVAGYHEADEILKGVDLAVGEGEIVAIIGPNGAGKSTLLKVIAGLLRPRTGTIRLGTVDITGEAPRRISARGLAYVPQESNTFPSMSVRENLEIGGYLKPADAARRIEALFTRFPMLAEKRRQAARSLSGGQRQVLAMAMALMVEPALLLLDEPSAGLSPKAAAALFDNIRAINREGVAVLMVEQNALDALGLADRGYILVLGRNSREGRAADLAADPDIRRIFLGG
jgi:branched-chain amino acid transport system ATP-binding protein/neutral amino acid transport system ATP-binding protein